MKSKGKIKISELKAVNILQEFSVPLIAGVIVAIFFANHNYGFYYHLVHSHLLDIFKYPDLSEHLNRGDGLWAKMNLHFLVNDVFMVIFFGIAAKEITEALLPSGPLHPIKKSINPIFGTIGGVVGPVAVFFLLCKILNADPAWLKGWGIPIATDIALAWLVARIIFGAKHPAISFLLLLAIIDDAIGLVVIALAYPDPAHPTIWVNMLWVIPGMAIAYTFRKIGVGSWLPYVLIGGAFSWWGFYSSNLHPALALVPIVPFMPGPRKDIGIFHEAEDYNGENNKIKNITKRSPLENFEHDLKLFVDFGLFFFAFANAGVPFSNVNELTWIILGALILGKTVGISFFSYIATKLGFKLADGMNLKHLLIASVISGLGLTVSLFIAGQAFSDDSIKGAAKMGALFSVIAGFIAYYLAKIIKVKE